jgi:hypothetical protein
VTDGINNLTSFEKDLLLRWFFHKLGLDHRGELMREFPLVYNKAVGQEVMEVINRTHEDLPMKCPHCQKGAKGESAYRHVLCDECKEDEDEESWECPTCQGPALASHDDGEQVFNLCKSCNAWFAALGRRLTASEVVELRLAMPDDGPKPADHGG